MGLVTGEASPYYIFHPHAAKRVSREVPQAKLIASLRNPIDRAYSHYVFELTRGSEDLSFEEAIGKEEERLRNEREKMLQNEDYQSFSHRHHSYLSRGIYVNQLKVWMSLFPKHQILILRSEDLCADPPKTLKQVLDFLRLPNWELSEYRIYNTRNYPKMDKAVRKHLINYFRPHNQRLYEYLGRTFDWDK